MISNYLGVITDESGTEKEENVLALNTDIENYPYLEYRKNDSWIPVNNKGTLERMAKFDDLYTSLYERDWNIGYRLFLGDYNKLYMMTGKYDAAVPEISKKEPGFLMSNDTSGLQDFEKVYRMLMKVKSMTDSKEIDLGTDYYRYLVSTRDLIDQSSVVDLYSYSENSTEYGNILNLNELLQKSGDKYQAGNYTIRLVLMYVKSGSRMSGTSIFNPFVINNEGDIVYDNFQTKINNDVTLEVTDGCVRIFPEDPNVSECIIYHCYLNYGKLL